ncbi:MAG: hypothetical protein ABUS56_07310 [Acidobacteriota bacterium]
MAVIKVPKTPKKAFDVHRRPSALLLGQIAHLEWAALPAAQRKPGQLPRRRVKTEGQAAERVAQLTTLVFAAQAAPREPGPAALVTLPPLPAVPAAPAASRGPARKASPSPARRVAGSRPSKKSHPSKATRSAKTKGARRR